jgi:hypothetical protein
VKTYLTQNKTDFGVTNAELRNLKNQIIGPHRSLQFYLGGRKPGTLSELDKAYYNKFSNGFKGLQWIVNLVKTTSN